MAKKVSSSIKSMEDLLKGYKEDLDKEVEVVTTSIECLDDLWGGGVHLGYSYSMWGPAGCGKSTLSLQIIKSFCKLGKKVVVADVEKAMNDRQIDTFGLREFVETKSLVIVPLDYYLELEELVDTIVADGTYELLVIDSETMIDVSLPNSMKVTDVRPGLKATQSSYLLKKIKSKFYHANIASIILFHARANIDMSGGSNGPDTKQAGGYAAEHVPDIITKITSHEKVYDTGAKREDSVQIGVGIKIECTKNKFAAPFRPVKKKLIFGKGILKRIDLVDTALEKGVILTGGGGYFTLPDGTKVRGTQALYDLPGATLKEIQTALKALK